jgi:hypothetical protein
MNSRYPISDFGSAEKSQIPRSKSHGNLKLQILKGAERASMLVRGMFEFWNFLRFPWSLGIWDLGLCRRRRL